MTGWQLGHKLAQSLPDSGKQEARGPEIGFVKSPGSLLMRGVITQQWLASSIGPTSTL